ncbi:hypothetical protein A2U01_0094571, partial [Trifolium medium]|nr:hypothetical protein [Trifolium medium]
MGLEVDSEEANETEELE